MIDPKEVRYLVYKIRNTVNGKLYFGITKCGISKRWNEHKHNAMRNKKHNHLSLAIRKYGVESFDITLVCECSNEEEMYAMEKNLIAKHETTNRLFGYNNSIGGEVSSIGAKHSVETRKRLSDIQMGKKRRPHSELTKQKQRIAAKNRKISRDVIEASVAARKGKPAHNRKAVSQFDFDGNLVSSFNSQREAAKAVGGTTTAFPLLKKGRLKTYKGYKWTFEN